MCVCVCVCVFVVMMIVIDCVGVCLGMIIVIMGSTFFGFEWADGFPLSAGSRPKINLTKCTHPPPKPSQINGKHKAHFALVVLELIATTLPVLKKFSLDEKIFLFECYICVEFL